MQERHHVVWLRVAPEHRLRKDAVARDVNVENAVCARHHLNCRDGRFELLENSRCQTDSVRPRASGYAVLNTNSGPIGHGTSLSADSGRSPDRQSTRTSGITKQPRCLTRHVSHRCTLLDASQPDWYERRRSDAAARALAA